MKRILNIIVILAILSLVGVEIGLLSTGLRSLAQQPVRPPLEQAAEENGSSTPDVENAAQNECIARVKDFMSSKQIEFAQFINEHFRSNLPTSSLVPVAIEKLKEYRKAVREEVGRFVLEEGNTTVTASRKQPACRQLAEEDMAVMKELLHQHIMSNAFAKKATRILDKYKDINGRLENLNFSIAEMFGYFASFSKQLPCYAQQCIKG